MLLCLWRVLSVVPPGDYSILSRLSLEAITLGLLQLHVLTHTDYSSFHSSTVFYAPSLRMCLYFTLNNFGGVLTCFPFSSPAPGQSGDLTTFNYYKTWGNAWWHNGLFSVVFIE